MRKRNRSAFVGLGWSLFFWSIFQAIYSAINAPVRKINRKPHM